MPASHPSKDDAAQATAKPRLYHGERGFSQYAASMAVTAAGPNRVNPDIGWWFGGAAPDPSAAYAHSSRARGTARAMVVPWHHWGKVSAVQVDPVAVRVMETIAEVGGSMMREGLAGDLAVEAKSHPSDLVTQVDRNIETRARAIAAETPPGYGFLGEEAGGASARSGWLWVVDPLDGTANYANRIQHAAVSVGLCHDGRAVAGIILDPFRGEKFVAAGDGRATAGGRALAVRAQDDFMGGLVLMELGGKEDPGPEALALFGRVRRSGGVCRVMGSAALSLAYVAAGRAAAALMLRVSAWDVAAGLALVEAAGGIGVRPADGAPYDVLEGGPLVAGSPQAVRRLRGLLGASQGQLVQ